jgi:cobalt-zinc-cadmium efflux system outer membrane protein
MQVPKILWMGVLMRNRSGFFVLAWLSFVPFAAGTDAPADNSPAGPPLALAAQIDLETALQWTLQSNPNLVATRQNVRVSAEALAVARYFPTSLNPSVSIVYTPWVFEREANGESQRLDRLVEVTWAQPIELGHQQRYREQMAQASYYQTQWNVLQAELAALIQTYRLHQTALYRREKLAVAQDLNSFSERLVGTLRRQAEANQATAADVVVAEVEHQATIDQLEAARQDYVSALADLRQQIGIPSVAASAEPTGTFRVPEDRVQGSGEALVRLAQESRPEVQAAAATAANSRAALNLARGDRIPTPSIGPYYERDENGLTFYGLNLSSPIPLLNTGAPLVRQREAEYHRDCVAWEQARQLVAAQVLAVIGKWNEAQRLAERTHARFEPTRAQTERMQRLYDAGQAELLKLLQVQRRYIDTRNVELDAIWDATQAYADLLAATGGTPLLNAPPR